MNFKVHPDLSVEEARHLEKVAREMGYKYFEQEDEQGFITGWYIKDVDKPFEPGIKVYM